MPYFGVKINISPVLFSGKHGSHIYNVASKCAFQVCILFHPKIYGPCSKPIPLTSDPNSSTTLLFGVLFCTKTSILLNLFKRNLRVIFVFDLKLVLIHIVIVYLRLILICWNIADWNLTLFSCSKYVIACVI